MIHIGGIPYKFDICNKTPTSSLTQTFMQQGNLRTHRMIHTGDKPCKFYMRYKSFTENMHIEHAK